MNRQLLVIVAILADLAGVALFLILADSLLAQFQNFGFFNSVLLGIFFTLFCLGVYAVKKLLPVHAGEPGGWPASLLASRPAMAALAVVLALFVALAAAYTTGFLDSVARLNREILDEPSATLYLLLTPASWFGLALIYVLVLAFPTNASVSPTSGRYPLVATLGLLGINLFAAVSTVFLQAVLLRFPPASPVLIGILIFLLYLLLFLPPRLIYTIRTNRPVTLLTFLMLLAFLVAGSGI